MNMPSDHLNNVAGPNHHVYVRARGLLGFGWIAGVVLFVAATGLGIWLLPFSHLYHNNGDGTFTDVTLQADVANRGGYGMGAAWGDYDNDGFLDLYVANYGSSVLYHNQGNGTFTDVTERAGGRGLCAAFADFNLDGWPDFYIGNDISSNRMFQGLGRGRFRNISSASWTEENRGTMGIAVGDFDGDGDLDFYLTHWIGQGDALYQNLWYEEKGKGPLHFSDMADIYGCGEIAMGEAGWGTFFFDFDNDGRLDLLAVNGSALEGKGDTTQLIPQRPFLFWSKGQDDGFYDLARSGDAGSALQQPRVGRGAACADYDRDGDLDMIIMTNHGRPLLLRNDGGNRNHRLAVRLVGTHGNRSGIGAKIYLTAGGKRQLREYGTAGSYLSQSAPEAWFGLGHIDRVEKAEVVWPSGTRHVFPNLRVNRTLNITEGHDRWQESLPGSR